MSENDEARASATPTAADEVRAHLRDVHRNEAAPEVDDVEALTQHYEEHHGPGGLRDHTEPAHLRAWSAPVAAGSLEPVDLRETLDRIFGDAQRKIDAAAAAAAVIQVGPRRPVATTEETEKPDTYDEEHLRALRPGSQPLPRPNSREGAHDALLRAFLGNDALARERLAGAVAARKLLGLTRYHTLLQAGNGRDSLRDAIEEVLDLAAYLQVWEQARDEVLALLAELRLDLATRGERASDLTAKIRKIEYLLAGGDAP